MRYLGIVDRGTVHGGPFRLTGLEVDAAMKIALLGTRGVPARYGGFETAVEEIGAGLAGLGHEVVVYCRSNAAAGRDYRGMRRVVLPAIHRKALETISHTGLATLHVLRDRPDAVVMFNAANAPYVALLRAAGIPTALHIDGHDARRAKWRGVGQRYYSWATRFGCRVASKVIVDSEAIQRELGMAHDIKARFIPYGVRETAATDAQVAERLQTVGLRPRGYHLAVARFEPENHVLEVIEGYSMSDARLPLVVVGFEGYPGDYAKLITEVAARDERVWLAGSVWDQDLLDAMYAGAASYLHGHSVGGTNPSLLRAMVHGAPVIAYDCPYNRETTADAAAWFTTPMDVAAATVRAETDPDDFRPEVQQARKRATHDYVWADVVRAYERLLAEV